MSDALARYLDIEGEDDLTRIVFGILELVGPPVIAEVVGMSDDALSDAARVEFHTRIDRLADRVPDVLIEDRDTTVMIEAKRGTDFDVDQLREEHDDLSRFGNDEKLLLLVTGHESRPAGLDDVDLEHVAWIGWRDVALRISRCDRSALTGTQDRLIELLRTKLAEEGYMPFTGFTEPFLEEFPELWRLADRYRGHIARFHRDLEGRLGDSGLQAKNVWRDGVSQDFNRFPGELQLVPSHLWIAYGEADEAINNKDQQYLFVAFCAKAGEKPVLRVGFSASPKGDASTRSTLIENADDIVSFVTESDFTLLATDWNFTVVERYDEEIEMTSVLTGENALRYIDRLQVVREYPSSEFTNPALTQLVAADLVTMDEFSTPLLGVNR